MTANNVPTDKIQDAVSKALRRAYQLGQTHWRQADSEYQSHWKKADETQAKFDALVDETRALVSGQPAQPAASAEPIELRGIAEALENGDGFWRSCSGCHELNEGHDTGPYSKALKCCLGAGCSECGGIGAIWDDTDYNALADHMARDMVAPVAAQPSVLGDDLIEWIETEVSAISCRYHGDPSYDHDAYWMREKVLGLIGQARKGFPATPPADGQAQWDDEPQRICPIVRDILTFVLWHHQGGSSKVGQPIRKMLGMSEHERFTEAQYETAIRVQKLLAQQDAEKVDAQPAVPAGKVVSYSQVEFLALPKNIRAAAWMSMCDGEPQVFPKLHQNRPDWSDFHTPRFYPLDFRRVQPAAATTQPNPAMAGDAISDEEIATLSLGFVGLEPLSDFDYVGFARALLRRVKPAIGEDASQAQLYRAMRTAAVADDYGFVDAMEAYANKNWQCRTRPKEGEFDAAVKAAMQQGGQS